jgi:tellurite resistance protein
MTDANASSSGALTTEQVTVFAAGLRYVADVDGITEHEQQVIREFLTEAGHPELLDRLETLDFEIERAVEVLDTTFLRTLFIKACVLLVESDGALSELEREALDFVAAAFGMQGQLPAIQEEVAGESLE